ncbi:MAG TPA: protein-S-isoprenylcysteine O-methyltransferase [Gemmatimonadales bacterium]|nr:protein-S-isoprenylcysteine O-methyltransferase [Gemmatimonadales bacterium]
MNPWFAKAAVLSATIVMVLIRSPHGRVSRTVTVAKSRKGLLEIVLLGIAWVGFFVPILWIATPWLGFAEFPLYPLPLVIGSVILALSLWLFHRSHADLGTNWSITLEIRESHWLVTEGVYRRVRHPMYVALLLYGLGQAAVIPNWVAAPAYAAAMVLVCALRLRPEEELMREHFKGEYDVYASRTKRLVPGVW